MILLIQVFERGVFQKRVFFDTFDSGSNVHKRFQETKIASQENGYGQFHDCSSQHLEDFGFRKHLEETFMPLTKSFDKVAVSVDGDCKFNKILKEKNVPDGLFLNFDVAHLKKNTQNIITNILVKHNHNGDSNGKIGNENKFRLCSYAKNTMVKVTKIHGETEDKNLAETLAKDAWEEMKQHCLGNHEMCQEDGDHCREEPVLRTYGDVFDQKKLDDLVEDLFDNYLQSEDTTTKLANFGNTSNLESYHSIYTNRDLWPKVGSLHVGTPKFEGIVAVASSIYNYGDRKTLEKMMAIVDWTVLEGNLGSLAYDEKRRDNQAKNKMKEKAVTYTNRVKKQKQFQTKTKYRLLNPYIPSSDMARQVAGVCKPKRTQHVQRKQAVSRKSTKRKQPNK